MNRLRAAPACARPSCGRLARCGIGLPAQRTLVDWIVRLFFHAPPPGRPDHVRRWVRVASLRLAQEWGVLQPLSPREWLWRAIVRSAALGAGRRARSARVVRPVCRARHVAGRAVGRRIDALLARLPWVRWGGWLDARANGVGRHRWLAPLLLAAGALLWSAAGMSRR